MAARAYWVDDVGLLNGYHEIHDEDCLELPREADRTPLGVHSDCWDALEKAKLFYDQVNGCKRCCFGCHLAL